MTNDIQELKAIFFFSHLCIISGAVVSSETDNIL